MYDVQIEPDAVSGQPVALSHRLSGLSFDFGKHGPASCRVPLVAAPRHEAQQVYDLPGVPVLTVSRYGHPTWIGRIEQRRINQFGFEVTAYGFARALWDVPYTALWSESGSANWRKVTADDSSGYDTEAVQADNINGVFIGLEKNATYPNGYVAGLVWFAPDGSENDIAQFNFSYETNLATGWTVRMRSGTADLSTLTSEWTQAANGTTLSGSRTEAITAARYAVILEIVNTSGGNISYTGETGAQYAKFTALRVMGNATQVYASDIVEGLIGYVNGINSDQLASSTNLVQATSTDINDAVYEDAFPGDILDELAAREGYEWGVDEERQLYFRPAQDLARTFYIEVTDYQFGRDLDALVNGFYARYRDENGRTLRTAVSDDTNRQSVDGIVRRAFVRTRTTSSTEAEAVRDQALTDSETTALEITVSFNRVLNAAQGEVDATEIRPGDTAVLVNLLPGDETEFVVARSGWRDGVVSLEAAAPVATLVTLVAGQ